jgi:hypothetical protein
MARISEPTWYAVEAFQKKIGLDENIWHYSSIKRCYTREGGVMRAQGWLVTFGTYKDGTFRYTLRFMPD